ncbi:MAG: cellulase family glycosylhydrolase [Acidobacteriaceae bacterium]|nr:cellulase family glycosylhydrolase [Acidobacteriaceae bacterium]
MPPLIRTTTAVLAMLLGVVQAISRPHNPFSGDGFVTTRGREIVGPNGKALHLRGINLGGWLVPEGYMFGFSKAIAPWQIRQTFKELVGTERDNVFWRNWRDSFITRDDIRYIRSTGMNLVRVPFDYRLFTPEEHPGTWVGIGFELLDRVVAWSRQAGLFVLLDMHAAPCGQNPWNVDYGNSYLFEDPVCLSRTVEVWRRIARHYAQNHAVIGYDILNEPAPADGEGRQAALDAVNEKIAAAISEVDQKHLLFLTSVQPDAPSEIFAKGRFHGKLVYTFHTYWTEPTEQAFAKHLQFAERYNVPIFLGESGENTDDWGRSFRLALERQDVGWAFWSYKRMSTAASMRTFDKPNYWDELVDYQQTPSNPFAKPKKAMPSSEHARAALEGLLRNAQFENTRQNTGYIEALGMRP